MFTCLAWSPDEVEVVHAEERVGPAQLGLGIGHARLVLQQQQLGAGKMAQQLGQRRVVVPEGEGTAGDPCSGRPAAPLGRASVQDTADR